MRRLLLSTAAAVGWFALASPSAVSASCAVLPGQTPGSFSSAAVVFVGTVLSTTNGDREATVKVESIWRGPDMQTYVRVVGTPEPSAQATSVDRTYQSGKRYLFVPENAATPFQDNNCSSTQIYTSALAAQAPADARPPLPGGDPGTPGINPLVWLALALVGLGAIGVAIYILRRRPRAPSGALGP